MDMGELAVGAKLESLGRGGIACHEGLNFGHMVLSIYNGICPFTMGIGAHNGKLA